VIQSTMIRGEEEDALQVLEHLKDNSRFGSKENPRGTPDNDNMPHDLKTGEELKTEEKETNVPLTSLNEKLLDIFRRLEKSRHAVYFLNVVDPQESVRNSSRGVYQNSNPSMLQQRKPMDFSIVRHKLERNSYASYVEFYNDFVLMVENSHKFCDVILPHIPLQGDLLLQMCANELLRSKDELMALEEQIRIRPTSLKGRSQL